LRLDTELGGAEELGVTVALETHDAFAGAALVADVLRRVESLLFAALWDVRHPYRVGESPETSARTGLAHQARAHNGRPPPRRRLAARPAAGELRQLGEPVGRTARQSRLLDEDAPVRSAS
jgi:hypothetical protein